ncbi:MAG: c-type cytochrome biogenesis protein CcmI, partial [Variibacter sp.]|nr:c-type cytochrome biogenesis protein CcmI [Variibacter sp.]
MSLWFFLGLMTLAAVLAVLWPLARRPSAVAAGNEVAVYRDQLAELERQTGTGLFAAGELQAARAEIGRRLLAAADAAAAPQAQPAPAAATFRRRAVAVAALLLLPDVAVGLYAKLGSPHLPGQPLAARETPPLQDRSLESLLAQVETRLESHPEDGRGWEVIAPIYLRLVRYEDAVKARRNALRLNGASAQRESDLGEALVYAAGGVVTQEAKDAFERALALDPKEPKARYFTGLA